MIKILEKDVKENNLEELIKKEEISIQVLLTFYEKLNTQVINNTQKIINDSFFACTSPDLEEVSNSFIEISKVLKKSASVVEKCQLLSKSLATLKEDVLSHPKTQYSTLKAKFDEYNKKYNELNKKISSETIDIQTFLSDYEKNEILKQFIENEKMESKDQKEKQIIIKGFRNDLHAKSSNISSTPLDSSENNYPTISAETNQNSSKDELTEIDDTSNIEAAIDSLDDLPKNLDNVTTESSEQPSDAVTSFSTDTSVKENTLIISEKNKNVVFPFTLNELEEKFQTDSSKYKNIDDIIEQEYTKPLDYYKNSAITRFKEAYKLVRKNHGSLKRALDLATEVLFKSNLHPAIISACKTIDDLDIYLSCLEFDELEDFKKFNIIFDMTPRIYKKA